MKQLIFGAAHSIRYTNWKGETEVRILEPLRLFWGSNEFHPKPQWLVECLDKERGHVRCYSLDHMVIL